MGIVLDCVRSTSSTQTRNSGLLLLAPFATLNPSQVLDSLLPVFTFVGENMLSREDNYTFHVVRKIMKTVLPALSWAGPRTKANRLRMI